MSDAQVAGVALLVGRVSIAFVYGLAAVQNTRFFSGYTVPKTGLILRGTPLEGREGLTRVLALAGLVLMAGGTLSLALGLHGKVGAAALALFTVPGTKIHFHDWRDARALALKSQGDLAVMAWSAYSGHFSSALKNVALVGANVMYALVGTGTLSIDRLW